MAEIQDLLRSHDELRAADHGGKRIRHLYTGPNITVDEDLYRAMEAAGGPGYSIVDVIPEHIVNVTYETGAIEPDGSIVDGTVTFFVADESMVEQPVADTPEPSMLATLASGFLALIVFARRKVCR
jgi:hypothetical protein